MSTEKHYTLNEALDDSWLLKKEKWIDRILNLVKEKIFWNDLNTENIERFKEFVRRFTSLYYLMKDKFSEEERTSWERYFEHLRAVVNNVLELPDPNTLKVLIAIAHDSLEDTNKTFEWLHEDYGYGVALAVLSISKDPWEAYLDVTIEDGDERKARAKISRNAAYFWHLASFESFKEHIKDLARSKWLDLSDEECAEIAKNALDVKFADRIHNLSTQWDPNDLEQVRKKVEETEVYFMEIARETNIEAYNKLQSLIFGLKTQLHTPQANVLEQVRTVLGAE